MQLNFKKYKSNRGFTYVELIVVLSIGALLSAVSLFNYKEFQDKINLRNLANEVALQIGDMQKSSSSGRIPTHATPQANWRPSYGVYFPAITPSTNKTFYLFADLLLAGTQDKKLLFTSPCPASECMNVINISKGNFIEKIDIKYQNGTIVNHNIPLHITFTRPNVGAVFWTDTSQLNNVELVEITLRNNNSDISTRVEVYSSGRIQIN